MYNPNSQSFSDYKKKIFMCGCLKASSERLPEDIIESFPIVEFDMIVLQKKALIKNST